MPVDEENPVIMTIAEPGGAHEVLADGELRVLWQPPPAPQEPPQDDVA